MADTEILRRLDEADHAASASVGPWNRYQKPAEGPWTRYQKPQRFEVTSPDGKRYEITAPPGTSEADALAYFRKQHTAQPAPTAVAPTAVQEDPAPAQAEAEAEIRMPDAQRRAGIRKEDRAYYASPEGRKEVEKIGQGNRRALINGLTFGAGTRLNAAVNTGFGLAGDYGKELERIRADEKAHNEAHPIASTVARTAGAMMTGGAVAPVFNGIRAAAAPVVGDTLATAAGVVGAGGAAGAATKAIESEDYTKPGQVVKDAAVGGAEGAAVSVAPYLGLQAARVVGGSAGGWVRDVAGRWTNTGGEGWAQREREKLLANYLRREGIQIDRATPQNAQALGDNAATYVSDQLRLATVGQGPGQTTPVSYALNRAYDRRLADALRTEGANHAPMANAARGLVVDQPAVTRDLVLGPTTSERLKADLVHRAGPGMTPEYERIGGAPVNVPTLARLLRNDENVAALLPVSTRAAVTEGRLPPNMVQQTLDIGQPGAPAVTTAGVLENMLRRAGGRINPENSADVVTDMRAQEAIVRALQADGQRSPALGELLRIRREHGHNKAAVDNFERGQTILRSGGPAQDDAVNAMLQAAPPRVREAGAAGARASVVDLVSNAPEETVANVANAVVPEGRRRVLAAALGRRAGHYNHQAADQVADHLEEVGRRSAHSASIQRMIEGGPDPSVGWPEQLARAAVAFKAPTGFNVSRFLGDAQGMNASRASALMDDAARPVTPAVRGEYADLARALVARQLVNPTLAGAMRIGAPVVGQEVTQQ